MRSIWKGSISFGLINIPISLFPATQRDELKFRLLRASDLSPVSYKRVADADGKEVPWDQIVKGFEYEKDKFVVMKDTDFKRVDVEATQTVDIVDFVPLADINPIYFEKPYYMEPGKGGAKAYALLREALRETGMVGIAKVVIKARQHLAAVKPNENALLLEIMRFSDELVEPKSLHLPGDSTVRKAEMGMAKELIDQMSDKWDPDKYKDDYKSSLLELIEEKVKHGDKAVGKKKSKAKAPPNVIDLAAVLRDSLKETSKRSKGKTAKGKATKVKHKKAA